MVEGVRPIQESDSPALIGLTQRRRTRIIHRPLAVKPFVMRRILYSALFATFALAILHI
jgi:hypothetical protein